MENFSEYGPMPPPPKQPPPPSKKLSLLAYTSQVQFKRSGSLLEQTNEVRVRMQGQTKSILKKSKGNQTTKEQLKKKIKFNEEVEEIQFEKNEDNNNSNSNNTNMEEEIFEKPAQKMFDFKREYQKQQLSVDSSQFPEEFGRRPLIPNNNQQKNPALSRKEQQIYSDYSQQYGKGAGMFLKQGGSLVKGLGKYEQGRMKPVEAIRKNQYMGKAEAKIQKLISEGGKEKEKEKEKKVEKERMWKIDAKKKSKEEKMQKQREINQKKAKMQARRHVPTKTLDISYTDQESTTKNTMKSLQDYQSDQRAPITNQKVVDMTGTETRFFENYQALKTIVNESTQQPDESCKEYRLLGDMVVSLKYERKRIKKRQQKLEIEVEENEIDNLKYELKQREYDCKQLQSRIQQVDILKNVIPKLREWGESKQSAKSLIELLEDAPFDEEIMEKILVKSLHGVQIDEVLVIGLALKKIFQKSDDSGQVIERILQNVIEQITKKLQKEWNPVLDSSIVESIDQWINNLAVPVDIINSCNQLVLIIFYHSLIINYPKQTH